jgi:small-conductance mechanosensitive channel
MTMAGGLDIKHKVGLALFYLVFISVLVVAIAGIIVIAIVGRFFPAISTPARSILFATLLLIAIVFMFFFALGFFVYGIMMFRTIKQVDQDVQVWDKKFMKFMIITDLLFMLFCIWLFIVTLNSWLLPNVSELFCVLTPSRQWESL